MSKKRGSGEGSVFRYRNGWRGQITIGDKRVSFTAKTKGEVIEKMAAARTDYNRGLFVFDSDVTVREWVETWLDRYARPRNTEQSFIRFKTLYDKHLLPVLGDYKLQELNKPLLEEFYATEFREKGIIDNKDHKEKEYSHAYVNALSSSFKKCLSVAVENGILTRNPHEGVQLHKLRPPKKIFAYDRAQHDLIVNHCKYGHQLDWIIYVLISTGMRIGEAAALTWDDVDLEKRTITINKSIINIHGRVTLQEHPKTSTSIRTISVPTSVNNFLQWAYKQIDQELNYRNLVLPNMRYNFLCDTNVLARWKKTCEQLGIPYQGVHSLRHTWATRALEQGIDVKTVSAMLGHKNIITTMNIYQDVLHEQKEKAADKLENLF